MRSDEREEESEDRERARPKKARVTTDGETMGEREKRDEERTNERASKMERSLGCDPVLPLVPIEDVVEVLLPSGVLGFSFGHCGRREREERGRRMFGQRRGREHEERQEGRGRKRNGKSDSLH